MTGKGYSWLWFLAVAPWGEDKLGDPFRIPCSMLHSLGRSSEFLALWGVNLVGWSTSCNVGVFYSHCKRMSFLVCLNSRLKITAKV